MERIHSCIQRICPGIMEVGYGHPIHNDSTNENRTVSGLEDRTGTSAGNGSVSGLEDGTATSTGNGSVSGLEDGTGTSTGNGSSDPGERKAGAWHIQGYYMSVSGSVIRILKLDVAFAVLIRVIVFIRDKIKCKKQEDLPLSIMEVGYGHPIHKDSTNENGSVSGA